MNRSHPTRRRPLLSLLAAGTFGTAMLMSALGSSPAQADDAALYGPDAPPNSAFVRIVNASANPDLDAQVGDKQIDGVAAWSVSEFEFLPAGAQQISAGSAQQSAQLQADHFYTAVVDGDRIHLFDNSAYANRLKALVILYNLTDKDELTLRTSDGGTTVVEPVKREDFGLRQVNAARARLAVFAGDARIAETPALAMVRGKAYSVFAIGPASAPRLVVAAN